MADSERMKEYACCAGAAARAGWWSLLLGFVMVAVTGVAYLFVVHTPLLGAVSHVWGVGEPAVRLIWIVFISVLKLVLTIWLLCNVFLSILACKLKKASCEPK